VLQFLSNTPRFVFFTGKGGVGKTSIACATAIHLAGLGQSVLLVSTDPASNVGQVLGVTIGNTITAIAAAPGLSALEIDPEQAAEAYRERIIAPVRGLLPDREIAAITEQLSGSCTTEVASFNEFTALLAGGSAFDIFDHIVFDTAPTGHTIRLLQLPGSWTEFLNEGKGDASCLGPLAGLEKQRSIYAAAVGALKDPARTRLVLVTRAQLSAMAEIDRTASELDQIGIRATNVIVNGVLPVDSGADSLGNAIRDRERWALGSMPSSIADLPRDVIELKVTNMIGIDALARLLDEGSPADSPASPGSPVAAGPSIHGRSLHALVDELELDEHGLIMCMGKGGVGKTTIAASIAVALADRGHTVHLTTTDPAAHIEETLAGAVTGLRVSRIDPVQATQEYRDRIMATKGARLDDAGRANLSEDLMSPCTEEVAVFQQFSRIVNESRREFVVVDTAPTGHTLLLLDAAGSYHRDVVRQMGESTNYTTPLMRLQDPQQTKVILVTLAEPTPVTEAQGLQDDLMRAGITPWAWVITNSLAAAEPESPFLRLRARAELDQILRVEDSTERLAIVPLLAAEPIGAARLGDLLGVG
jgi:arsenite-transporting ATPase